MKRVTIRVPATTANLGPGFDAFGCALSLYTDVTFEETAPETDEMTATLGLPAEINGGDSFNGVISINKWDNEAGYKLIDFIVNVPEGVTVTDE